MGHPAKLDEEAVRAIRASDDYTRVLAEQYGVSISCIRYIRAGTTWRDIGGPVMPSKYRKLTKTDVEAIRASTETQAVLAQRYGVSQPQISRIKSRRRRA